jgi:hypothetical protein
VSLDSRGHRSLDEFGSQNEEPENFDDAESEGVFFEEEDSGSGDEVYLL